MALSEEQRAAVERLHQARERVMNEPDLTIDALQAYDAAVEDVWHLEVPREELGDWEMIEVPRVDRPRVDPPKVDEPRVEPPSHNGRHRPGG